MAVRQTYFYVYVFMNAIAKKNTRMVAPRLEYGRGQPTRSSFLGYGVSTLLIDLHLGV